MNQPLSRCPFCGGKATLHHLYNGSFAVICDVCRNSSLHCKLPQQARKAWNKRYKQ